PGGDAEVRRRRVLAFAVILGRMRGLVRFLLGAVRGGTAGRVGRLREKRGRGEHEDDDQEKPADHTALPRRRSAARRASESDSRTIFSRASFTSCWRSASASETIVFASPLARSRTCWRCAPA